MTTQQTPQKRRITVIPPNPQLTERDIHKKHLRVAPYCRVSTDSEEQLNSYNAQIAYYTEKIAATPEWTMVRLYADEGITGTSMKRRKEFLKMLRDCDRGKIDLIITKSVSRFGRNTLDGLDTVRKLKRKGIGVFFEKENTNTLYMDNEMILTFMMSQAQAESESLSGSVKWGHRKNFKDGKVYYHYASFLGYRKGPDGLPEIDPDEAAIVRRIFARYLLGQSVHQICRDLMSDGVKTAQGSDSWHDSVVRKMLQNEKYIGDALLQKTFMADLFTHEQRKNMGELPQYYVHECHPAIIDRDTFQRVQEELARRSSLRKTSSKAKTELGKYCGKYVLSELLVCGECGTLYRRCVWAKNGRKRVVWRCVSRLDYGTKYCHSSPTLDEEPLQRAILAAINEAMGSRDEMTSQITEAMELELAPLPGQAVSLADIQRKIGELEGQFNRLLEQAAEQMEAQDYMAQFQRITDEITTLKEQRAQIEEQRTSSAVAVQRMATTAALMEKMSPELTEWDESWIRQLVDTVKVLSEVAIIVYLRGGIEIRQSIKK